MKEKGKIFKKLSKNGFYIILFLCICAIGISGYVMFQDQNLPDDDQVLGDWDVELPLSQDAVNEYDFESASQPKALETPESSVEQAQTPAQTKPAESATPKQEQPKTETAASTQQTQPKNAVAASNNIDDSAKEIVYVPALNGEVSVPYSGDELIKSKTMGDWRIHTGVDIAAPEGTKVCAIADGTVKDVYEDEMMGFTVVIEHKQGTESTYCNLMKGVVVKKGQQVKAGDVIGGIGSTAIAECMEAPHLHLELTNNDKQIDPMSVIKAE